MSEFTSKTEYDDRNLEGGQDDGEFQWDMSDVDDFNDGENIDSVAEEESETSQEKTVEDYKNELMARLETTDEEPEDGQEASKEPELSEEEYKAELEARLEELKKDEQ